MISDERIKEIMLLVQKDIKGIRSLPIQEMMQKTMFIGNNSEEKELTDILCCLTFIYERQSITEKIGEVAIKYNI